MVQKLIRVTLAIMSLSFGILILLITLAALAWRATSPGWLIPFLLGCELFLIIALATVFRHRFKQFLSQASQFLTTKFGLAVFSAFLGVLLTYLLWPLPESPPLPANKKVAIIGGGATGAHAAWMLHQAGIEYTLYEAAGYIGGHAYAADFRLNNGRTFPVDMGFMFGAPGSYEEFKALLKLYGVERTRSQLSYSAKVGDIEWKTDSEGPVNKDIKRFEALAAKYRDDPAMNLIPFGWWLWYHDFDEAFFKAYQVPFMAVLFVTTKGIYENSTRFMLNMYSGPGRWVNFTRAETAWFVDGGSSKYYRRLTETMNSNIRLFTPVTKVKRSGGKIKVTSINSSNQTKTEVYDAAIMAVPAEVANRIVDTSLFESFILSQARYDQAMVYLHSDSSVLPPENKRRAYNYLHRPDFGDSFEMSGMMGRVLKAGNISPQPIVTLNPKQPIDSKKIQFRQGWRHHIQDLWHIAIMQTLLPKIQGRGNLWYAGEWEQFIGHGQALRSGMRMACFITGGKKLPPAGANEKCYEVTWYDAREPGGKEEKVRLCGIAGAYNFINDIVCHNKQLQPPE